MLLRDELIGDVCPECDELEKAAGSWAAAVMNERNEEKRATVAEELTVAAWSAELMFSGMNDPDNPMCRPLVWVLRHREQKMPDQRVYTNWTSPHEKAPQIKEDEARIIAAAKFNSKKDESLGEAKTFGLPAENQPRSDKDHMVDTIIAQQVVAGGYDTEGTRAQAERWCAMLAGCVCEGMRATTEQSAYGYTAGDGERDTGVSMSVCYSRIDGSASVSFHGLVSDAAEELRKRGQRVSIDHAEIRIERLRGKPLGRP